MIQLFTSALVIAALITIVFGRKAGQDFFRCFVGAVLLVVAVILVVLFRMDTSDKPQPGSAPLYGATSAVQQPAPVPVANGICSSCNGTGRERCPHCAGMGEDHPGSEYDVVGTRPASSPDIPSEPITRGTKLMCSECGGSGTVLCPQCHGTGRM